MQFLIFTDINGDFLTGYFRSIGKLDFVGGANGVVEKFLSDLRKIIDFPSNDDLQTKNGSNIQQFLDQFLMYIENAAVQTLTGQTNQNNVSQCIRQVIEVNDFVACSPPSLSLLSHQIYICSSLQTIIS